MYNMVCEQSYYDYRASRVQVLGTSPSSVRSPVGFFLGDINMKRIPLSQGKFAIVDDEDYDWLSKYKWNLCGEEGRYYGKRSGPRNGKGNQTTIMLHREILGLSPGDSIYADHIDHDTLNCRKANLRICTASQNRMNTLKHTHHKGRKTTSDYKGVTRSSGGKWSVTVSGQYVGLFDDQLHAAYAYDKKAREIHGQFAHCNFKDTPQ